MADIVRHSIQVQQKTAGFFGGWIRIDLAFNLTTEEIAALKRTKRTRSTVLIFTPYRRFWHIRAPRDRKITAGKLIDGRYVSLMVPAVDASSKEQEIRAKCREFLQQVVDAKADGSVRSFDLDTGKLMRARA